MATFCKPFTIDPHVFNGNQNKEKWETGERICRPARRGARGAGARKAGVPQKQAARRATRKFSFPFSPFPVFPFLTRGSVKPKCGSSSRGTSPRPARGSQRSEPRRKSARGCLVDRRQRGVKAGNQALSPAALSRVSALTRADEKISLKADLKTNPRRVPVQLIGCLTSLRPFRPPITRSWGGVLAY